MVEVVELVDSVEGKCRHSHLPCPVGQGDHIATLRPHILPQPRLQPPVIDKVRHEARRRMQLHGNAVHGKPDMVQTLIVHMPVVAFSKHVGKRADLLA